MGTCPVCQSNGVFRSHRRGLLERGPLTWLGVFPYRCGQCQTRFYRLTGRLFRRPAAAPEAWSPYPLRQARWTLRVGAEINLQPPQDANTRLTGRTENVSLHGLQMRLPARLEVGSRVAVHLQGEETRVGTVRWHRERGGAEVLHGIELKVPVGRRTRYARPLRRLLWRQRLRRVWFSVIGLVLMAGAAYGLVWLLEMLRVYDPKYYEPKDIERHWYDLRRGASEAQRPAR